MTPANLVADDKIRAFGVCEIDAGFTGLLEASLTLSGPGNSYEAKSLNATAAVVLPVRAYTGANALFQMTPEVTIGAATLTSASLRLNHLPSVYAAVSANVRRSRLGVYKIINEGY